MFKAFLSLIVLTSSVASAKIENWSKPKVTAVPVECGDLLITVPPLPEVRRVRDIDILNFLAGSAYMRAGEQNAAILDFYRGNEALISVPGVVTLIRGLRPEGPMPTHAQFVRHIPRDFAARAMLRSVFERYNQTLTERDRLYLLGLVHNPRLKAELAAEFPPPQGAAEFSKH